VTCATGKKIHSTEGIVASWQLDKEESYRVAVSSFDQRLGVNFCLCLGGMQLSLVHTSGGELVGGAFVRRRLAMIFEIGFTMLDEARTLSLPTTA